MILLHLEHTAVDNELLNEVEKFASRLIYLPE